MDLELTDKIAVDYGAAKAALLNVAKALSQELAPKGIRINSVSPGPVSTAGRFSTPEEVATLVLLLASPRTGNVTGSDFVIDGGLIKTM